MANPSTWLRWRVPLGFLFAIAYVILARPATPCLLSLCALFILTGCALRSWAAGYLFKGKRVAVGGPYAYVRNPLYVGSFVIGVGFCLVLWSNPMHPAAVVLWVLYFVGFGIVYPAKTKAEERELAVHLGPEYVHYAAQVPAFLPLLGRVANLGEQRFSGELYKRNREYECIAGCCAILLILVLKWRYAG